MQLQLCLFLFLLLSAGCDSKHSSNNKQLNHEKFDDLAQINLTHFNSEDYLTQDCIVQIDNGIEVIKVTKEYAEKNKIIDLYQADPGFVKWLVLFHDFPGAPPYFFEQKRHLKPPPDHFSPCKGTSSEVILEAKKDNKPAGLLVSGRGFLPGEKITIRLSGQNGYREITLFPRPLVMKNKSGKLLAKAELLCPIPGQTFYHVDFCGIEKEEKCKIVSQSAVGVFSYFVHGPMESTISPEVIGQRGGVANLTIQFEDGAYYSLKLPWGYAFQEYLAGTK